VLQDSILMRSVQRSTGAEKLRIRPSYDTVAAVQSPYRDLLSDGLSPQSRCQILRKVFNKQAVIKIANRDNVSWRRQGYLV
jgi:hypothetical protein